MTGLINIGMDIEYDGTRYKLNDKIEKLLPKLFDEMMEDEK